MDLNLTQSNTNMIFDDGLPCRQFSYSRAVPEWEFCVRLKAIRMAILSRDCPSWWEGSWIGIGRWDYCCCVIAGPLRAARNCDSFPRRTWRRNWHGRRSVEPWNPGHWIYGECNSLILCFSGTFLYNDIRANLVLISFRATRQESLEFTNKRIVRSSRESAFLIQQCK